MPRNKKKVPGEIDSKLRFPQKSLIEIIYFPIFFIIFIIFELEIKKIIPNTTIAERMEFGVVLILFGLLHILSSNILSYLYNLQYLVIPFNLAPLASPKRIKILGGIVLILGLLFSIGGWIE